MIVALIDSGRGSLPTTAALRKLAPDLDLLICSDPVGAPWGGKTPQEIQDRVSLLVDEALAQGAQAIVVPCNTASLNAREALRARLEPEIPVIVTEPAIKPAAIRHRRIAVWATPATAEHEDLATLIRTHAEGCEVAVVPCPGLAQAIDANDTEQIQLAAEHAAGKTPPDVDAIVLGCTHYALAGSVITGLFPRAALFDGAEAVARQALKRIEDHPERFEKRGNRGWTRRFATSEEDRPSGCGFLSH